MVRSEKKHPLRKEAPETSKINLSRESRRAGVSSSLFGYWKCTNPEKYQYILDLGGKKGITEGYRRYVQEQEEVKEYLSRVFLALEESRGGLSEMGKFLAKKGVWGNWASIYLFRNAVFRAEEGFSGHPTFRKAKRIKRILERERKKEGTAAFRLLGPEEKETG